MNLRERVEQKIAEWRKYAASTFNYGSSAETRAIEASWRHQAKCCADEMEKILSSLPEPPQEPNWRVLSKQLFDALDKGGFRWDKSLSEEGKRHAIKCVKEIVRPALAASPKGTQEEES